MKETEFTGKLYPIKETKRGPDGFTGACKIFKGETIAVL